MFFESADSPALLKIGARGALNPWRDSAVQYAVLNTIFLSYYKNHLINKIILVSC